MSQMFKAGADKAPILLGGSILGLAIIGSLATLADYPFDLGAQVLAASVGLVIAFRYA